MVKVPLLFGQPSLAERVIPETMRADILQGYQAAEAQVSPEIGERYHALVTQYEQE